MRDQNLFYAGVVDQLLQGRSQADLARLLGVAQPLVCRWRLGRATPSKKNQRKLDELMDVLSSRPTMRPMSQRLLAAADVMRQAVADETDPAKRELQAQMWQETLLKAHAALGQEISAQRAAPPCAGQEITDRQVLLSPDLETYTHQKRAGATHDVAIEKAYEAAEKKYRDRKRREAENAAYFARQRAAREGVTDEQDR